MAINKKLIHFKTKKGFLEQYDEDPKKSNILDSSIVFIKDSQEIWTHGQFYNCSVPKEEFDSLYERVDELDSEAIKTIFYDDPDNGFYLNPDDGIIEIQPDNGINVSSDSNILSIGLNTDYVATREYVDSVKTSILGSEELNDSYDTLQEVADWIDSHSDEAANIISDVNSLQQWKTGIDDKLTDITPENYTTKVSKKISAGKIAVVNAPKHTVLISINSQCSTHQNILHDIGLYLSARYINAGIQEKGIWLVSSPHYVAYNQLNGTNVYLQNRDTDEFYVDVVSLGTEDNSEITISEIDELPTTGISTAIEYDEAYASRSEVKAVDDKLSKYLPLEGGTMANTNLVTNLNAEYLGGKKVGKKVNEIPSLHEFPSYTSTGSSYPYFQALCMQSIASNGGTDSLIGYANPSEGEIGYCIFKIDKNSAYGLYIGKKCVKFELVGGSYSETELGAQEPIRKIVIEAIEDPFKEENTSVKVNYDAIRIIFSNRDKILSGDIQVYFKRPTETYVSVPSPVFDAGFVRDNEFMLQLIGAEETGEGVFNIRLNIENKTVNEPNAVYAIASREYREAIW